MLPDGAIRCAYGVGVIMKSTFEREMENPIFRKLFEVQTKYNDLLNLCACGKAGEMDLLYRMGDDVVSYFARCTDDQGCGNITDRWSTPELAVKKWNESCE